MQFTKVGKVAWDQNIFSGQIRRPKRAGFDIV